MDKKSLLHNEAIKVLKSVGSDLDILRSSFENKDKFYQILSIVHGRFSKIELLLLELEKLNND